MEQMNYNLVLSLVLGTAGRDQGGSKIGAAAYQEIANGVLWPGADASQAGLVGFSTNPWLSANLVFNEDDWYSRGGLHPLGSDHLKARLATKNSTNTMIGGCALGPCVANCRVSVVGNVFFPRAAEIECYASGVHRLARSETHSRTSRDQDRAYRR